jgi:hypothetical protein
MANLIESIEAVSDAIDTVNVYDNAQVGVIYMSSNKEYLYGVNGDVDEVVSTIRYNNEMVKSDRASNEYSVGRAVHNYRKEGVLTDL